MADPVSLAVGSMAISAVSGGVSAYGASQSAKAKAQMANYQAGIAQMNAKIAQQNADYAKEVGETRAQQVGMQTRYQVGQARVARGASGLDVNTGSNPRVIESVEEIGQHNEAITRADAAKRAYGYEVEAANATAQGTVYQMQAQNEEEAGKINVASTLLGTAGSVSDKWLTYGSKFPSLGLLSA